MLKIVAALITLATPLNAQGVPDDIISVELVPGWQTASGGHVAGLRLTLAPGWHTYWRAPGEAGIPPRFDWSGSENFASATILWPIPKVFDQGGIRTLIYKDSVTLPVEIAPVSPGTPVRLQGRIDLGVCEAVCVPVTVNVAGELDGPGGPDPAIEAALANQPSARGPEAAHCAAVPIRDGLRLTASVEAPETGQNDFAVIELADATIWVSPAASVRAGGRIDVTADLVPADAQPFALDRSDVRVTVFSEGGAVEVRGCTG
jgi:DsbC/DsbD-like thiol-disulfide interchange protein